jgi:hypothetical protein
MWRSIYCYLSGQHDYQVTCEPAAIFLRCRACGQRSSGWELREELARDRVGASLAHVEVRHPAAQRRAA